MNLKDTLGKIVSWAKTFPQSRADEMVQLAQLGIDRGWYLNEVFLFAIYRDFQEGDNLDCFLQEQILSDWDPYWAMIISLYPERKSLLTEAKMAFEHKMYSATIHLCFSQADGIFYDKFGKNLFTSRGERAKEAFDDHLKDFIARGPWELLIDQFKDASVFRRMYNEVYKKGFSVTHTDLVKETDGIPNEQGLVIPNRHGVLHGIHRDYGSKLNSLKCLSLLLFVVYAINGDKTHGGI